MIKATRQNSKRTNCSNNENDEEIRNPQHEHNNIHIVFPKETTQHRERNK